MPDKFTQFGEFFMQGLARTLAEGTVVQVPHVGACTVSYVSESRLLQSLEDGLESMGYSVGFSDGCDIHLITDYMPSDGISALALKPSVLKPELIRLCQELVRKEVKWNFWIRFGFDFPKEKHKGFDENILVRPDRVVHDYDAARLAKEFPGEVPALTLEAGS